jgi:hypothetical protein
VIRDRLTYGRKAPLQALKHERKHGRDLTWTLRGMPAPEWVEENWPGGATVLAVRCQGSRDGKLVDETRYYVTSLRTSAKALLQHVRERWSIENSWHWPRDTQLKEDAHRYREVNGVQIMATLRSLAMNALRLDGFWSITEGLAALSHDIRGLLALLGWREPPQVLATGQLLMSPGREWCSAIDASEGILMTAFQLCTNQTGWSSRRIADPFVKDAQLVLLTDFVEGEQVDAMPSSKLSQGGGSWLWPEGHPCLRRPHDQARNGACFEALSRHGCSRQGPDEKQMWPAECPSSDRCCGFPECRTGDSPNRRYEGLPDACQEEVLLGIDVRSPSAPGSGAGLC